MFFVVPLEREKRERRREKTRKCTRRKKEKETTLSTLFFFFASLRELDIVNCAAVPAFVGGLESLQTLRILFARDAVIAAPLDFLIEGCPYLSKVALFNPFGWNRGSMAHINAFSAKLSSKNPRAKVSPR